jgi:alanine racemase
MTRPVRARIDLQALAHNLSVARRAAPASRIMAVIKANAYGHGAVAVAHALAGADAFAVASVEEAMQLCEAGISKSIVLLEGIFEPAELGSVFDHRFQMVVHTEQQLQWLEGVRSGTPLCLWLKINTGMNRLGFSPEDAAEVWQRLERLPFVKTKDLRWMSHLACADECDNPATTLQLRRFGAVVENRPAERSLANSAALLTRPDTHFEWVRPGIMLYGASPMVPECDLREVLRPAMTFESRLIAVHRRKRGDCVGYGQTWVCPDDMPVGVVAAGYADGYPRHAPSGTPVVIDGRPAALVGRVSMDMLCVDLREQPRAQPGDPVVLWGEGLPVETVAELAGTISYELLCGVGARVPRIYTGENALQAGEP